MREFRGFYWSPSSDHLAEDWAALAATGANGVVLPHHAVTAELLEQLAARDITVAVDVALFAGAALRASFPDSAPITEHGEAMGADDWYVPICPSHAGVRAHHLQSLQLLLERHGAMLDGIWLDFIRYPMRWEVAAPRLVQTCFCDRCLGGFLGEPGRAATADERRRSWLSRATAGRTGSVGESRGLWRRSPTSFGLPSRSFASGSSRFPGVSQTTAVRFGRS